MGTQVDWEKFYSELSPTVSELYDQFASIGTAFVICADARAKGAEVTASDSAEIVATLLNKVMDRYGGIKGLTPLVAEIVKAHFLAQVEVEDSDARSE